MWYPTLFKCNHLKMASTNLVRHKTPKTLKLNFEPSHESFEQNFDKWRLSASNEIISERFSRSQSASSLLLKRIPAEDNVKN